MKTHAITMAAAALGFATMANSATWTVGPGTLFDFPQIQQAINASSSGDTIDVYPWTYIENLDLLGKDIHLRSTAGLGSVIVDGSSSGPVISCVSGESNAAIIEGFVLTNGAARNGGGMLISASSPTVRFCNISNNRADNGGGAAVYKSKTVFEFCHFQTNRARARGGHLDLRGGSPQVRDSQVVGGQAGAGFLIGFGGGVHALKTDALLVRCAIEGNRSTRSGGGVYAQDSNLLVEQCTVSLNESNDGGGLFSMHCNLDLLGSSCRQNRAHNSGGGLYNAGKGDVTIDNCRIELNDASDDGGGILVRKRTGHHMIMNSHLGQNLTGDLGAGICYFMTDTAQVVNSELHRNIAMNGGGLFVATPNALDIERTIFDRNEAQQDGGGLYARKTIVDLLQCTFVDNAAGMSGGAMKVETSSAGCERVDFRRNTAVDLGGALYLTDSSTAKFLYCNLDGNAAGAGGAMLNEINSTLGIADCKTIGNVAWSSTAPGGGLSTDASSTSRIQSSLFCNNTTMNIHGLWVDLGGNTVTASCP